MRRIAAADGRSGRDALKGKRRVNVWPCKSTSRLAGIILLAVMLTGPQIGASADGVWSGSPWRCDDHLLPDFNMSSADSGGSQRGHFSICTWRTRTEERLSCGGDVHLSSDEAPARLVCKLHRAQTDGRRPRLCVADAGAQQTLPVRRHIAVAWAVPHGASVSYKDTT